LLGQRTLHGRYFGAHRFCLGRAPGAVQPPESRLSQQKAIASVLGGVRQVETLYGEIVVSGGGHKVWSLHSV
jgi:hypothetical protein